MTSQQTTLRERILADVQERKRLRDELRRLRDELVRLMDRRRSYGAKAIAERYRVKLRQVNAIAYQKCEEPDHIPEKTDTDL